jgi:hypothetical protein
MRVIGAQVLCCRVVAATREEDFAWRHDIIHSYSLCTSIYVASMPIKSWVRELLPRSCGRVQRNFREWWREDNIWQMAEGCGRRYACSSSSYIYVFVVSIVLPFFSSSSTAAYHAPPTMVRNMPSPFMGVTWRLNRVTEQSTASTCLTFAIVQTYQLYLQIRLDPNVPETLIARAPTFRLALKLTTLRKKASTPFSTSQNLGDPPRLASPLTLSRPVATTRDFVSRLRCIYSWLALLKWMLTSCSSPE